MDGGAFRGRGFQVVEMFGLLLKHDHALAQVIEKPNRQIMPTSGRDVLGIVGKVANHLVDAVHPDGGEV